MKYALRKLIAFVFLLGMFWYIFQDVDNIWNPAYMASIGGLMIAFAVFWIIVPLIVVWIRIWRRTVRNRRGYDKWVAGLPPTGPKPHHRNRRLNIDDGETVWFHEKGTFYVEDGAGFDEVTVLGRIGDVAFPHEHRVWRKAQRVHCYFTDRRILFLGKEVDCDIPLKKVVSCRPTVGGIVFRAERNGVDLGIAFTFVNPLIAADIFRRIML